MVNPSTRRRVLALSAVGLSTSLAGCTTEIKDEAADLISSVYETPIEDSKPPGKSGQDPKQPPDTPAARLRTQTHQEYTLYRLPVYKDWYTYTDLEWPLVNHPDTRPISIEVTDSGATVRIEELHLIRDLAIAVRYQRDDGAVTTSDWKQVSPNSETFHAYEWKIPFDTAHLPKRQKALAQIVVKDHTTHYDVEHILAAHHFVAIPYENSIGAGTHYINSDRLNYIYVSNGESETSHPDRLVTEYIDTDEERTRFFVMAKHHFNNGENYYTGYTNVPHDAYEEYLKNQSDNDYRSSHHPYTYAYNADNFEYFTRLVNSFVASLDANGVTDHFSRLQQLAFLIGCLRYQADEMQHPQLYTLYEAYGDCADMTMLYLSLLNTAAFDYTRGAMVACDLYTSTALGNHAIPVIDERDLGTPPDERDIHWVDPDDNDRENGIPDTRYAFLEVTQPRRIGAFNPDYYHIHSFLDTTNLDITPELREF